MSWCRKQRLIETNPCAELERDEKPKRGRPRGHVPSLDELRAIWTAVESESTAVRDLIRFLILVPLRRTEAASLVWREVDLARAWITIPAARMKAGDEHKLPLSPEALAILSSRRGDAEPRPDAFVFPASMSNGAFDSWHRLPERVPVMTQWARMIAGVEAAQPNVVPLHAAR
jgi:integrase